MTKPPRPKPHPSPGSRAQVCVVRAAKVIPAMERPKGMPEPPVKSSPNRCTGHCGHCEIHPCQLHTTI